MVRDPSIVSPSLSGVFIGGGVITNTVQDVEVHAAEAVSSPLSIVSLGDVGTSVGDDGGVTDRATTYIHIQTLGTSRERDF